MKDILYKYNNDVISKNKYENFINSEIDKYTLDHLEFLKIKPINILYISNNKQINKKISKFYSNANIIISDIFHINNIDIYLVKLLIVW